MNGSAASYPTKNISKVFPTIKNVQIWEFKGENKTICMGEDIALRKINLPKTNVESLLLKNLQRDALASTSLIVSSFCSVSSSSSSSYSDFDDDGLKTLFVEDMCLLTLLTKINRSSMCNLEVLNPVNAVLCSLHYMKNNIT